MRKFRIEVNGKIYEVVVEEIGNNTSSQPADKKPIAPAPNPKLHVDAPKAVTPGLGETEDGVLYSPMQGTIVSILVSQGDTVEEGDLVAVLEAMKMENDINAPRRGVVKEVRVKKGDTVTPQTVLAFIE